MQPRAQMPSPSHAGAPPDEAVALLDGTCGHVMSLGGSIPSEVEAIPLAPGLERAVPRRQMQFRAGRYCAMQALAALDPQLAQRRIGRSATGAPIWPEGVTGSITHTDDYASAAVAWTSHAVSLGIDTERIVSSQQAHDVGDLVASATELRLGAAAGLSSLEAFTLVFSAKESVFKCLHPLVGRMFEFGDVRMTGVDGAVQTFTAEIVNDLNEVFVSGTVLEGRFKIDSHHIHTGLSLAAQAHGFPEARASLSLR